MEFSELEEAFFREGDQMSLEADGVVEAAVDAEYYTSIAVTIEADEISGGFEVAA